MTIFNPDNPADRYFAEWVLSRDRLRQQEHELELAKQHVASLMSNVHNLTERVAEGKQKVIEGAGDWSNSAIAELLREK